ncbi:MAG: HAMP domain-containing protein [Candidatus Wallbacteria bacterium]|nr:HAMP domain-containing protein [Candidatus Wallbacteria bacterium]
MNRTSLQTRLLVGVLGPLVLLGGALHVIQRATLTEQLVESSHARAHSLGHAFASSCLDAVLVSDRAALDRITSELAACREDVVYAFVADATGEILAHSFAGGFPEALIPLARTPGRTIVEIEAAGEHVCHAVVPILDGAPGSVHVGLSERAAQIELRSTLLHLDLTFAMFGSLICVLVGLTQALALDRIRELAHRVGRLPPLPSSSEAELPEDGPDELTELAASFNRTRRQLRLTHDAAVESERLAAAGRLAAGFVHELNNPLASSLSCVEALAAGKVPSDRIPEYLRMTESSMGRVATVVRRMADFAAGPACDLDAPTDLSQVARWAVADVSKLVEQAGVRLVASLDEPVPPLQACAVLLEQVFVNLLSNAVEASAPGEVVAIRIRPAKAELVLEVEDHGTGMEPEEMAKIGEPFYTSKGTGHGLGLGLFLVRGAMRRHGGTLEVDSRPGTGTTMRLRFPLDPSADHMGV